MTDIALNTTTGDLDLSSGGLELVTGTDAIAQHLRISLRFFLGEWYLDQRVGIPYLQDILGETPRLNVLRAIFRKAILAVPGVSEVRRLVVEYTGSTRTVSVSFEAEIVGADEVVTFDEEIII